MRVRRVVIILLVVLLLGALVVPGAMAKKADKMVPLRGSFEGVGLEFEGNFTHLGHFDGLVGAPTVWTAANGKDKVFNTSVLVIGDQIAGSLFEYTQTIYIAGGEGRFVCAEGIAEVEGTIDLATFVYDGELEGTISQPNKKAEC